MPRLSVEEIKKRFTTSEDFNELLDVFQDALEQCITDIEVYRLLFWNHSLSPDELQLFGSKLVKELPALAYDTYMWLANVFAVTYSSYDNFELAMEYYKKAAAAKPADDQPYVDAGECYDPDLNIPPINTLIDFFQQGLKNVKNKKEMCMQLARLYEINGDNMLSEYFRRLADEAN
jgi:tetratricopeptide (TPR) repeat protein